MALEKWNEGEGYIDYLLGRPESISIDTQQYDRFALVPAAVTIQALLAETWTEPAVPPVVPIVPVVGKADTLGGNRDKLKKFTEVYFTRPKFIDELEAAGILYPEDWHMFMELNDPAMTSATFYGSMGGKFVAQHTEPVTFDW